ncbi:sterol desaturase family protein [Paraliomyxa miuraensis]|uniref:sterol desaturase family protein n=1 Tax=Paraliomyxa miuraensis TaxID=376150 RepID=UPI00224F3418|nr:sterol desaturase family protein [Paraliomyxa miuraensis]MCX4247779.1 sterol desaturase family protein [Paraliomyxa miuraensis]
MLDEIVRVLMFAGLAGLAFVPLERLYGHHRDHDHGPRRGRLADVSFATVGTLMVWAGLVTVVAGLLAVVELYSLSEPLLIGIHSRPLRMVADVAVGLLVFELMGYAYHRLAHTVPWMWRLHEVHHSSERMDWLASFRQHPLEILLVTLVQNIPLVLLGVSMGAHAMVLLLLRLNTVFVHADLDLRPGLWSQLVASPRFHHRHHQRDGAARNYSALFPWIDRLLGTYDGGTAGPVGVGRVTPRTFWGLMAMPFVRPAWARAPQRASR